MIENIHTPWGPIEIDNSCIDDEPGARSFAIMSAVSARYGIETALALVKLQRDFVPREQRDPDARFLAVAATMAEHWLRCGHPCIDRKSVLRIIADAKIAQHIAE